VQQELPEDMKLSIIEGVDQDKITRLSELSIDNCHLLATANPFVIWIRTRYTLSEIVDWIAQARLYLLFKSAGLKVLRDNAIRDIFTFISVAEDANERASLELVLKVPTSTLERIVRLVNDDPEFKKLKELKYLQY
jgi:hypothetical protein